MFLHYWLFIISETEVVFLNFTKVNCFLVTSTTKVGIYTLLSHIIFVCKYQAFFAEHPQYAENDFYITGESYAGHYIPAFAARVHKGNKAQEGIHINLKVCFCHITFK